MHIPNPLTCPDRMRLSLLLYVVAAMGGCWLVEQPGQSMLGFHPRVMSVFSALRAPWPKARGWETDRTLTIESIYIYII